MARPCHMGVGRDSDHSNPRPPWEAPPTKKPYLTLCSAHLTPAEAITLLGLPIPGNLFCGFVMQCDFVFLGSQMPGYFQSCNPYIKKPGPISRRIKKTALSQYLLKCRFFQSRSAEFCNHCSQEALLQEGTVS